MSKRKRNKITQKRERPVEIEKIVDRAFALRNARKRKAALALLDTVKERISGDSTAQTLCAILAWEMDDPARAIVSARRATTLKPNARISSEILFHALFDLGKRDEAFAEMKRFLTHGGSIEFRRLLGDLAADLRKGKLDKLESAWLRKWLKQMPLSRD